jgi:hypothetical protein
MILVVALMCNALSVGKKFAGLAESQLKEPNILKKILNV